MIRLIFCNTEERYGVLRRELEFREGRAVNIYKDGLGKPYCDGKTHFNLSHSGGLCAIALSPAPVGVDCELLRGKSYGAVLASFPEEERREIATERDFLMHWTAREAFAKLRGDGVWKFVRRLAFIGGRLYSDGQPVEESVAFCFERGAVTAICAEDAEMEFDFDIP